MKTTTADKLSTAQPRTRDLSLLPEIGNLKPQQLEIATENIQEEDSSWTLQASEGNQSTPENRAGRSEIMMIRTKYVGKKNL
jgi:hypothetical protein